MEQSKKKLLVYVLAAITLLFAITQVSQAHWSAGDGHKMHFPQMPDPHGWDVCLRPMAVADDFKCGQSGPITDIHFWISWKDNLVDDVLEWRISIHENNNSRPGKELWRFKEGKIAIREEEPSMQGWLCPCNPAGEQVQPDNHTWYAQINITDIQADDPGQCHYRFIQYPAGSRVEDVARSFRQSGTMDKVAVEFQRGLDAGARYCRDPYRYGVCNKRSECSAVRYGFR